MRGARRSGDEVLIQSAGRQFAYRAAGLVGLAIVLLVVIVTAVVVRQQSATADSLLRSTARSADDVGDPPPGAWLALTRDGRTEVSPGLPEDVAGRLTALRSTAAPDVRVTSIGSDDERHYKVATLDRRRETVQVVLDLTETRAQRDRLLKAMGAAAVLGLLLAAGVGALLGRRAVRPLADALALQRTFVADASHELRTPLTLLSTRAQVLQSAVQRSDVPDQVKDDAAGVVDDVHRLAEVVEDLLVAADPRRQQPTDRVDVRVLVHSALDSARAHADQAGVTLHAAIDDAAGTQQYVVLGAATALRRAVLALIDNAIDHTPSDGRVTVSVEKVRGDVSVTVSDTGPGIAPEARSEVLRRFHSGGQRSGRQHYGLGLALTHDVADRHGGHLQLLPSDTGATFRLTLPAVD